MAHSKSDDNRDPEEIAAYRERDLLTRLQETNSELLEPIQARLQAELDAAVQNADAMSPAEPLEDDIPDSVTPWTPTEFTGGERVANRIYAGLRTAMENDPRIFLLGEDIEGPYGGAFKVTKDLSLLFPGRVRNTPISEQAITGVTNGLALAGIKPVQEIMFGDFSLLALDQIVNHTAKFNFMYGGQVQMPLVVRTPMGGKRGYGPTHSQSLEKHMLGIPGTRVLALHHRFDPAQVYSRLLSDAHPILPTIVLENKILYGSKASPDAVEGFCWYHSEHQFPISYMRAQGRADATIVCYGGMLQEAEKAVDRLFAEHDLVVEILCPMQLYPLQCDAMLQIAARSGRLLFVEEGHGFCGFTAELMASFFEANSALKMRRLYSRPQHIPSAKPLELRVLPGTEQIIEEVLELVR
jgi:2-oxoisovalerate dehydrogenase E1 component